MLVFFDQLFEQAESSWLTIDLNFGESNLMLVRVNVASAQDPIRVESLLVKHLAFLELLNLFVSNK